MKIVATFSDIKQNYDEKQNLVWKAGECYQLLQCQNCEKPELRNYYYHEFTEEQPYDYTTLYPESIIPPRGLPKKVREEYERAVKARHGDSNGYGVLLGRVLESVCQDKKAKGKMIGEQLKDLADRNELPAEIITFAEKLNRLRVFGAHFNVGKLTAKDIPIMENLIKVILEYVYSAPFIIKQAERAIKKVDGKKAKPPKANILATNTKTRFAIPIYRKLVKEAPLGEFEEISIEMLDWEAEFLDMVANQKLIKYNVYNMPTLSQDIKAALYMNEYRDLILQDDHDQHFLLPKGK